MSPRTINRRSSRSTSSVRSTAKAGTSTLPPRATVRLTASAHYHDGPLTAKLSVSGIAQQTMFERGEYVAGSSAIHSKLQKLVAGALR